MKEWTDDYNPFNTWKILFHIEKLKQIANGEFPVPVTVDTDVSNACNQNCIYCNSEDFRDQTGAVIMSKEHLLNLADMYKDWGVMSTCIGGGGEPTTNKALPDFIERVTDNEIEAGVISNGVLLNERTIDLIVERCRFLGISLDSYDKEIYKAMRGKDDLDTLDKNLRMVSTKKAKIGSNLDFCAKLLIHPLNHTNLYDSVKMCKEAGFNAAQVRPVAVDNIKGSDTKERFSMEKYLDVINEQIVRMHEEIEDENFKVYAVTHKFAADLGRKIDFEKCRATPIQAVFGADGWVYCCFNVRGYDESKICKHSPDPYEVIREWGGERHKQVIEDIDPINRCLRCTYNRYNAVIEKAILEDNMFYKFP